MARFCNCSWYQLSSEPISTPPPRTLSIALLRSFNELSHTNPARKVFLKSPYTKSFFVKPRTLQQCGGQMVNRRKLLTALVPGLAVAQTVITPCMPVFNQIGSANSSPIPCNGQCPNPACGQMHPPIPHDWQSRWPEHALEYLAYTNTLLVRCQRCSNVFCQDPEAKK